MKETTFRGKRIDNGEWVYGDLIHCGITGKTYIFSKGSDANESNKVNEEGCLRLVTFEVIPETVGQYAGLHDVDDKEIYGDNILMLNNNKLDLCRVCFGEFDVRDVETEEIIDKVVGWYMKPIKTDAISRLAPFCYESPLNDFWIKRAQAKVISK